MEEEKKRKDNKKNLISVEVFKCSRSKSFSTESNMSVSGLLIKH